MACHISYPTAVVTYFFSFLFYFHMRSMCARLVYKDTDSVFCFLEENSSYHFSQFFLSKFVHGIRTGSILGFVSLSKSKEARRLS